MESGDADDWDWGPRADVSTEEPLLKEFLDASGTAKWGVMAKLVDTYIDASGRPMNEERAEEVWDAEGWSPGEGIARMKLFYQTLHSFRALILADPTGTEPASEENFGDDIKVK